MIDILRNDDEHLLQLGSDWFKNVDISAPWYEHPIDGRQAVNRQ